MRKALLLRTANNRCPFLPGWLALPMNRKNALEILLNKGYMQIQTDVIDSAKAQIGVSRYETRHHPDEAPEVVDCASFVRWVYSLCGIWLPRYAVQQRELGKKITLGEHKPGDLIFCQTKYSKYWTNPNDAVGHVGMITGQNTVIHAACKAKGVIESHIKSFTGNPETFRGIRRICPLTTTPVLQIRPGRLIETLEDLRWDILNSLGR